MKRKKYAVFAHRQVIPTPSVQSSNTTNSQAHYHLKNGMHTINYARICARAKGIEKDNIYLK